MGNSQKKTSCLEPIAQLEPNFDGIVIGWSFSKIVSGCCRTTKHKFGSAVSEEKI
jgi:hypothetical protein